MKSKRNPTLPRLEYVARQYPDYVTIATIKAWAEAIGAHQLESRLMDAAMMTMGEPSADPAMRMLPRLMEEQNIPSSSDFDRYLPWAAREFNHIYKPHKRIAKKHGEPKFPRGVSARDFGSPITPHSDWYENHPIEAAEIAEMLRNTRTLVRRFAAAVNWASEENIDLNPYGWLDALEAASKWMDEKSVQAEAARIIYEFDDGWTVQELSTKSELKQEGKAMGHCVGSYTIQESEAPGGAPVILDPYTNTSAHSAVRIFSLRGPAGGSHATLEWSINEDFVKQLRGKQNAMPKREYLVRMVEFRLNWIDKNLTESAGTKAPFPTALDPLVPRDIIGAYVPTGGDNQVFVAFEDTDGVYLLGTLEYEFKMDPDLSLSSVSWAAQIPELRDSWFLWKSFGNTPPMRPVDEMVSWLVEEDLFMADFQNSIRANPRRARGRTLSASNPMAELKRRLMR